MGVRGMKTLAEDTLEDVLFRDSSVVIDGPNLYYSLYFNSEPKLDQQHGGDYAAFRDLIRRFFLSLERSNISPLVLLDGGAEAVKGNTVAGRLRDKVQKAKRISESRPAGGDNILPPLVKDVFIQALQELGVEVQQCFGEADLAAALRANQRTCPVLSNDSDFYIFDVQEGFLLIDGFQWERQEHGAIPARRYRISEFCRRFRVDQNHMSVFAALSGNDYSRLEDRGAFSSRHPGGSGRQRNILGFLGGLRGKTAEEAVREALQLVGKTDPEDFRRFLDSSQQYALKEAAPPNVPEWIRREVRRGRLTSFVYSVLIQKSMTLTPLVEDFSQPSSYSASLRIRQFFFGLLVGRQPCRVYDREGAEAVLPTDVAPLLPAVEPENLQKLQLEHLHEAPEDLRRSVFYEALRCSGSDMELIPDQMKLPLCVTRFWFQYRQQNHPDGLTLSCLQALVLGFVFGEPDAGHPFKVRMDCLKAGRRRLEPPVAHAFSQWQNCLRQSLHLNQLLSFALPEPQCSRLYCGPLLHNLQELLQRDAEAFTELRNLLEEPWRVLLETFLRITATQSAGDGGWQTQKRKKKQKNEASGGIFENKKKHV